MTLRALVVDDELNLGELLRKKLHLIKKIYLHLINIK